jgi:HPt (histidine-containing phosphotransfer) domain-containing protein
VDELHRYAASGDPLAAAEVAHSLKGAAAIIGAEPLRRKAATMEAIGRAGEKSLLLAMVHELRCEMDRCLAAVPSLRTDMQRRSSSAN